MKRLTALILICAAIFSIFSLSSCASSIPSMYMNVNAPVPQLGTGSSTGDETYEAAEQTENDDDYNTLTGNVNDFNTTTGGSSKTVSKESVTNPQMYSSTIPSTSTPSISSPIIPSPAPSSSSPTPPTSQVVSEPVVDPNFIPTTSSPGIDADIDDDDYSAIVTIITYNSCPSGSFEYNTAQKDVQMSIIVKLCEGRTLTDPDTGSQYFAQNTLDTAYQDYFGVPFTSQTSLTSKSGVTFSNGKYIVSAIPDWDEHTKYIRSVTALGNNYYKVNADIRVNNSVIAEAIYVVKINPSSKYGANLIAQKITPA